MSFLLSFFAEHIITIGAGLTIVAGLFGWGIKRQKDGEKKQRREAEEADRERADDLKDAAMDVRIDPDGGVRDQYKNAGFRD